MKRLHFTPHSSILIIILFSFSSLISYAQYDCSNTDPCDNLVCFDGFEAYPLGDFSWIHNEFEGEWLFDGYQDNTPTICGDPTNKYLFMSSSETNQPGIAIPLLEPIAPGCTYCISFEGSRTHHTFEHSWTFGTGLGAGKSKSVNPSYTFNGSGTYQVSHTVTTDCGEQTVTYEISVECDDERMCACEDNFYNIGSTDEDTYYSQTGLPTNLNFVNCLSFIGKKLIIDVPEVKWKAVIAFMGPGTEIEVLPGNKFNYTIGTIQGCEKTWEGMTILEEGTFVSGALKVKDAYNGLHASSGSAIQSKQMTFENCYVGMHIKSNVFQLGGGLRSCKFTSPGPFLPRIRVEHLISAHMQE